MLRVSISRCRLIIYVVSRSRGYCYACLVFELANELDFDNHPFNCFGFLS